MDIVIIGNSAAGLSALEEFRRWDRESRITIISKEGFLPYSRVLLPYMLRGKLPYEGMTIRDEQYFKGLKAECVAAEVVSIDSVGKNIVTAEGDTYHYDRLLIASGSFAVMPPIPGIRDERICNMWTKNDADRLLPFFGKYKRAVVIGSGFVALQAAWAARFRGLEVTVIELMDRIMPSVLDEAGARILTEKIQEKGVVLHTGAQTREIEHLEDGSFMVHVKDMEPIPADFIIVGTGVRPNTGFLEGSGVTVSRGIPVDSCMRTNIQGIYAAGDVAEGPTTFGEPHVIHALWPTAVEMGQTAGRAMAGKESPYEGSLNMNVTQMYDVTVASIGKFNDDVIDDASYFDEKEGKGYLKVCYKDGKVCGACLVGSSDAVAILGKLRPLIRGGETVSCTLKYLEQYVNLRAFALGKIQQRERKYR